MSLQIAGEASIEKLPEHILVEIMSYLSMKDRGRAARVCKHWSKLIYYDSLWRHVDLLEFRSGLKTLWQLVRTSFSPCMSTLKLRGYDLIGGDNMGNKSLSDAVLKRIAARCPNLEVLHLHDCHTKNFTFESLPTSIVCLEMVNCTLKPGWMTDKQKHLPKLEHLLLKHCFPVNDSVMEDISVWRNLKGLSFGPTLISGGFRFCKMVYNSGVITIANNLYELEYLNICMANIDDDAVYHITMHLKKLRQLCLAQCYKVTDKSVVQIAKGLPMLNKLDISHCYEITMRGLVTLFGGSIRELIAVGLFQLSGKDKQALKRRFAVTRVR